MSVVVEDRTRGTATTITIEELTATIRGGKPRKLTLVGAALPFKGAEWGSELNLVTKWYPGNAVEATQQVLGPRELPTSWEGEWRRTMLGVAPSVYVDESGASHQIVSPHILRNVLEDFQRGGARLRVIWGTQSRQVAGALNFGIDTQHQDRIVREGQMRTLKFPHDASTDIRWNAEWHWSGRGGRAARVASIEQDIGLDKIAGSFGIAAFVLNQAVQKKKALNKQILAAGGDVRKGASNFTLGRLEAIAQAPLDAVASANRAIQRKAHELEHVVAVATKIRTLPDEIVSATIDIAKNTLAIAKRVRQDVSALGSESFCDKNKLNRAAAVFRAYKYVMQAHDAAELVSRRSYELDERVRKIVVSGANNGRLSVRASSTTRAVDLIAVHVCRQGETPTSVSSRFYRSPDYGDQILRANRLPWHTAILRPGQILVIPALGQRPASG